MERINGLIARKGIRPMTDRIAHEVLVRTDFAETHYMSMLAMLMGIVAAFTLIDPISLWSSIVGSVVILMALILNETAWSIERQRVTKETTPTLGKQIVAWYTATPIVIQLALLVSLPIRISTYPPQEAGAAGVSGWWYAGLALIVIVLYLYQLLIEYFVRYYQRSMSAQVEAQHYAPLFAYRYQRGYQANSPKEPESTRARRALRRLLTLWELFLPWHYRLQSLLYRHAHQSGVPAQFVQQMPQYKRGVGVTLGLLSNYNRWVLLVLTLAFRWELWYLVVTGVVMTLMTLGVQLYLESEYRKLYEGLLNNLHSEEQQESPQ
ncbi:hypothetical protein [uncultured Porphyromonas sp.]|uniref:hypothetical protein n=1 Tax=uncultured Porphyromonas sp. TaxID=159274 RepID=UPI0025D7517A|nr:hypothetical protein [uncultured Porphyromonas sp.]